MSTPLSGFDDDVLTSALSPNDCIRAIQRELEEMQDDLNESWLLLNYLGADDGEPPDVKYVPHGMELVGLQSRLEAFGKRHPTAILEVPKPYTDIDEFGYGHHENITAASSYHIEKALRHADRRIALHALHEALQVPTPRYGRRDRCV